MAARRKTTEARWRALVREQEESGETVKGFARSRGLSPATLYWWRSALCRRPRSKAGAPRLAQVALLSSNGDVVRDGSLAFELGLPSGHRLRVPSGFDPEALRRLLSVLEAGC